MHDRAHDLIQEILSLPTADKVRVVEAVVHDLAAGSRERHAEPDVTPSLLGLFADEPDLVDEVCRMAMEARGRDKLRASGEHDEGVA